jgi:hypothetical protein
MRNQIVLLIASVLAGVIAGSPLAGFATTNWDMRVDESDCAIRDGIAARDYTDGVYNPNTTYASNIDCAYNDSNVAPHSTISTGGIGVNVYDGSAAQHTEARACVHDTASTSWACGTVGQTTNTFTGYSEIYPGVGAWQNVSYASYYPIVSINLGPNNSYYQEFYGFTLAGSY